MTDARAVDVHAETMTAVIASDRVSHSFRRAAGPATQHPRGWDGDADVLCLIRQGATKAALDELMRRHGRAVYKYCRDALCDSVLADDIHQQVFVEAYQHLERFESRASLRAWLFVIARYRVLDAARSRRRERALMSSSDLAETTTPQSTAPAAVETRRTLRQALEASLGKLPVSTRTLVLLRFQHGLTFDELAAQLGEPAGTLQRRVTRALPRLRADLRRWWTASP